MLGAKGLIRAPQNKGIVKKKTKKQVPIYAIMDHNCTKTCSKMLLTFISVGKHILNLTWKIILSFIWMVQLEVAVEFRWRIGTGHWESVKGVIEVTT